MIVIPAWLVGAFFGGLITSFLWIAALTAISKRVQAQKEKGVSDE